MRVAVADKIKPINQLIYQKTMKERFENRVLLNEWSTVIAHAWSDEAFLLRLQQNPLEAIQELNERPDVDLGDILNREYIFPLADLVNVLRNAEVQLDLQDIKDVVGNPDDLTDEELKQRIGQLSIDQLKNLIKRNKNDDELFGAMRLSCI